MAELIALGGAIDLEGRRPGIGGSSYLVRCGDVGLLCDFGQYPQSAEELQRIAQEEAQKRQKVRDRVTLGSVRHLFDAGDGFFSNIPTRKHLPAYRFLEELKSLIVLITHAHLDHVGPLPFLAKLFPETVFYMTEETLAIASWLWENALHIARQRKQISLFNERDVQQLKSQIRLVQVGQTYEDGLFDFQFFPAGHIRGAASCLVGVHDHGARKTVFFTGDICFHDQLTVLGAPKFSSKDLGSINHLVTEATYGGSRSVPREAVIEGILADVITCLEGGGNFLAGTLAIARSMELYRIFKDRGVLDHYPVYVDGSAKVTGMIYRRLGVSGLEDLENHLVRDRAHREEIVTGGPCVMIAPSAMYAHGWSQAYAQMWAGDSRNIIAGTSYLDPCSPGFAMLNAQPGNYVPLGHSLVQLWAQVKQYQLSAHMDGPDILELNERLNPAQTHLVHADERAMDRAIAQSSRPLGKIYLGQEYPL